MSVDERSADDPEIVAGFAPLAGRYDVALCDVWGVLHDGVSAFKAASDALMRYRDGGGVVILVSNAPRPGAAVVAQLDRLAVPRLAYDGIVTSGDLTRRSVRERAGQPVHHLGPPRDLPIFEGLDVRFADVDGADYVVCSGLLDDDNDRPEDYGPLLERMRARGLPMICANPDLVVERGHELVPCAGAVAKLYEEMGGEVYYAGKPHRPVYDAALDEAAGMRGGPVDPRRVVAIGDAIRTDVAGAATIGADTLLIARGIHAAELGLREGGLDAARTADWAARQTHRPTRIMEALAW